MIPVKLTLRNFMTYRDNVPPLDFAGIHTASICGDNGSGKSALIDAITWALWGQTRAGARNHDSLVHSQQNEMQVEFDFKVGAQLYRVIRKHAKPKRRQASGPSSLDLFLITESGLKPISGDRIKETEDKIKEILHMDYDTFVNSAYLRQGHADQFTIADSTDRKKVLANILGLSRYDELEEQAKELAKQRETEKTLAESAIKDIDGQLAEKPADEARLTAAESQLLTTEKAAREQEARLNDLRQKKEQREGKQRELSQLEEYISRTSEMLTQLTSQAERHRSRIKEYEGLIAQRTTIEEGYAQLLEARKLNETLNEKLGLLVKLTDGKNQLDRIVQKAQGELITQHAVAQNQIGRLETEYQKLPQLRNSLQRVQSELLPLAEQETALLAKKQNGQELRTRVHSLEADKTRLEREIKETEEKLDLLLTESGAKCPLCETELGAEGLQVIKTKYLAEREGKHLALKSSKIELSQKKTELSALESEISQLETRLNRDRTSRQTEAGVLARQIGEAEKAGAELNETKKNLTGIEERLARKDFALSEQETLRRVEDELARLSYDTSQHEEVRRRVTSLEQYESPKRKLEDADRLINQEKVSLSSAEQTAQELRRSLEADSQKRQKLTTELSALAQLATDLAQAEAEHQRLNLQLRQAQETVGSIRGRLEFLKQLEITRKERGISLSQAAKEESIYRELAEAFGKNGVQAWLIETVLPELQDEANQLLARMTDNRMHVKFETQRETKKGDVAETLDIQIADELGTRSYEMFSGGEAFRINFAIRIALSKLLARRAGAPLPTLIIDEGFGTQDSTGMEKLKEAIISIQDDFEKILVITHVEELRDAFPTRIDVVKTAEGSTIEISA